MISQADLLVNSSDIDGPNPLSITGLTATVGTIVYNGDLTWTYTPAQQRQRSSDAQLQRDRWCGFGTDHATFTVTAVNDAPTVVAPLASVNVLEDAANSVISLSVSSLMWKTTLCQLP